MDLQRRIALASAAAVAAAALLPAAADAAIVHGRIAGAIRALQDAKADLAAAVHDFGGHRAAALAACDHALEELHAALNWAAAHNE